MTALLLVATLAAVPPSYLAERVITTAERTRRVTVFRDGTTVVALREGLSEPTVIRQRLQKLELDVVARVVDECYDELARLRAPGEAPGGAWIELRVAPGDREPLIVRVPLAGTPMAVVARLSQALDGIESRLLAGPRDREDLSRWQPARGDRVRLDDGRIVEVLAVRESEIGVVVNVRINDSPLLQNFTLDELRRVAVRRVAR